MTIADIISAIDEQDEDLTVYASRIDGKFTEASEVALLMLTDEEHDMDIDDVADKKCPGFEYFMELFMVKEMLDDMANDPTYNSLSEKAERIIQFQQFDE